MVVAYTPYDDNLADVTVWDLETGTIVGSPLSQVPDLGGSPSPVWAACVADRDGDPIVLGGSSGGGPVFLWDPIRCQLLADMHRGVAVFSTLIVPASDGDLYCWGDSTGDLYLRSDQAGTLSPIRRITAHDGGIEAIVACHVDGQLLLVTGGRDGAVRVWHPDIEPTLQSPAAVAALAILPPANDGPSEIVAVRADGTAPVFDASDGRIYALLKPDSGAQFESIAPLPGETSSVITVDSQGQVAIWRPPNSQPEMTWQLPEGTRVCNIAVAEAVHPVLLVAQADGCLSFYDAASGQPVRATLTCGNASFGVVASTGHADGRIQIATRSWQDHESIEWTIRGNTVSRQILTVPAHPDPVPGYRWDTGGLTFASVKGRSLIIGVGSYSGLHIWDAGDGSLVASKWLEQAHQMMLHDVAVTEIAGRSILLCGGYTSSLALLPFDTLEEHHLRVGSPLWVVKSLPDSKAVVAGPRGIMVFRFTAHLPERQ